MAMNEVRINIDIDDNLMKQALQISGLKTKKDVVEQAMFEFIERRTRKDLRDLRGNIKFADDYDYKAMREL